MKKDLIRQSKLEEVGFTIIRYSNEQVLRHISLVKENIFWIVEQLEGQAISPRQPKSDGN
jgi:very-short-patch-repair endonuclease